MIILDALFGDPIDWDLIEAHWQDLLTAMLANTGA
jgi:hypothetical protein